MIGTIIVTHGKIGSELLKTVQSIVSEEVKMAAVSLNHDEDVDLMRKKVSEAIMAVESGDGVLILCDMFGGTPSNICMSFLEEGKVEIITGVNLPMLIKLANLKENKPLTEMAVFIENYGKKNITLAGEVLKRQSL